MKLKEKCMKIEFNEQEYEDQLNNDLSFQQESFEVMQAISVNWKHLKPKLKKIAMDEFLKQELDEFDNLLNYFL